MLNIIIQVLLIFGAFASLIAAFFIYKINEKSIANKYLSFSLLAGAGWVTTAYFIYTLPSAWILSLAFCVALFIAAFSLLFILAFTGHHKPWSPAVILGLTVLISIIGIAPGMVISSVTISQNNIVSSTFGPLYFILIAQLLTYICFSLYHLARAFIGSTGLVRLQLIYILVGYALATGLAVIFNVVLPTFNYYGFAFLGPTFFMSLTIGMAYAITKHYLYEIRVVISELLVFLLILSSIVWLILNPHLFNLVFFLILLSVCIMFIRSSISEAEKRLQLEKDKQMMERLDKLKDEFLQMTEHELNTPIAIIEGKLSMILDENMGNFTDKQKDYLRPVFKDARRLARLSKELAEVSEIDLGEIELFPEKTHILDLVAEVIAKYRKDAVQKGLKVEIHAPEDLPILSIDQDKIKRVLGNLVDNAIKFTTNGVVKVEVENQVNRLVISVIDTGVGIKKEDQQNIFGKFYQADRFSEIPMEQQGTGLSLYISKNLIKLHGGDLWLESTPGLGSKFSFSLPFKNLS